MPLGKMLKRIKSQATSGKKVKKSKSVLAETNKAENDIDILNMVGQINLDNSGISTTFEPSNGYEHSLSKKAMQDPENASSKKRKAGETTPVSVPKRRQSSSTHRKLRLSTSTSKASQTISGDDSPGAELLLDTEVNPDADSKSIERKMVKGSDKNLLVSSLKQKLNDSESYHNDESNEPDEHDMKVQSHCQVHLC